MKLQIDYQKLKKEVIIRSIKMLDIGIITTIYFIIGYIISWGVNKLYYDFNEDKIHNSILVFLEICTQIFVIGIITTIYFIIGYFVSWGVNKLYYNFDQNERRKKIVIFLESPRKHKKKIIISYRQLVVGLLSLVLFTN